ARLVGERNARQLADELRDALRVFGLHASRDAFDELLPALIDRLADADVGGAPERARDHREGRARRRGIALRDPDLDVLAGALERANEFLTEARLAGAGRSGHE